MMSQHQSYWFQDSKWIVPATWHGWCVMIALFAFLLVGFSYFDSSLMRFAFTIVGSFVLAVIVNRKKRRSRPRS